MAAYIQQLLFEPKNIIFSNIIESISNFMLTSHLKKRFLIENEEQVQEE